LLSFPRVSISTEREGRIMAGDWDSHPSDEHAISTSETVVPSREPALTIPGLGGIVETLDGYAKDLQDLLTMARTILNILESLVGATNANSESTKWLVENTTNLFSMAQSLQSAPGGVASLMGRMKS
jgi:hypothetical protein